MIHANPFSAQSRLAKNNNALARSDHFLHVMQVEPPAHERFAQGIWQRFLQCRFKDFFPPAESAQRSFDHFATETNGNITFFARELRELGAILMTPRKMGQQVFHGFNSEAS